MNLKKELSGVADAVTKIMDEALKGNQHKIDANKNGKVDAHDFKLLRSKKKVEEASAKPDFLDLDKDGDKKEPMKKASSQMKKENVEDLDEGKMKELSMDLKGLGHDAFHKKYGNPKHRYDPTNFKKPVEPGKGMDRAKALAQRGMASLTKEEQEFIDELNKSTLGSGVGRAIKRLTKEDIQKTSTGYIHHARPGVYGGSAKEKHVVDTLRGPKKSEIEAIEKEKKMKKSFSEMLDLINSQGLKALSEMIKEEPDNETFTKELKDQEAKAAGKKKQPDIAKGSVQAVKVEEDVEQVEERSLTEPEMKKKEDIVKSMKKGLSGFKARYGKDAKSVMYATATKQAKGE